MNLDPLGEVCLMLKQVGAIRDISSTVLLLLHIVGPKMDSIRPVLFKTRYNSFHKCSVQPFFSLRRGDIPISHDVSQSNHCFISYPFLSRYVSWIHGQTPHALWTRFPPEVLSQRSSVLHQAFSKDPRHEASSSCGIVFPPKISICHHGKLKSNQQQLES